VIELESPRPQANSEADRPAGDRLVCISPDETIIMVLQLETRSGGREYGCIQPGLVQSEEGLVGRGPKIGCPPSCLFTSLL